MQRVHAKKSLGQHFLTDLNIAQRIADSIFASAEKNNIPAAEKEHIKVLEIGPGMGVLTQYLLENPRIDLTAIEIDRESVRYLKEHYPKLNLIEGDFLKKDLHELYHEDKFCIIGNYPYNISSQIFFKVLEYKEYVTTCSGMIQKEVAERIVSTPGKKAYGILSVLLQAWYDIEYLFTVDNNVFNPPPKVKSAVIRLHRNKRTELGCDDKLFKTIVKSAFNKRRKQLKNSLHEFLDGLSTEDDNLKELLTKRPEQLSVEEFINLTKLLQSCQN